MIKIGDVTKEQAKQYNPNWPQNPDYSYRILIIGGPWSVKKLINVIYEEPDSDKIHVCDKDPYEAKHQFLIKKKKDRIKTF